MSYPIFPNITTKIVHSISYSDFEKLVQSTYNVKDYSFACDAETGNDTTVSVNCSKSTSLDEFDKKVLETFKQSGKYSFIYSVLIQDMINNDVIPKGDYLINVSW